MNIYKKIYDDVKDLSKDDILVYLQSNIESIKNDYKIRISKGINKMTDVSDIELEQMPDIIKSFVKISPKELIYLLVNKYLRDKKNKILPKGIKLANAAIGLDLAYCIYVTKDVQRVDIKMGQRIFGKIEIPLNTISSNATILIEIRTPFKNRFTVPMGDLTYLFRNSKLDDLLKMLENE
jgi:hypothetical protein